MNIGDRIKDNDPRMPHRVLTIKSFGLHTDRGVESVFAQDRAGRVYGIATKRIYSDGKPRRSGFDLLPPSPSLRKMP